jgi:hypothetical protein
MGKPAGELEQQTMNFWGWHWLWERERSESEELNTATPSTFSNFGSESVKLINCLWLWERERSESEELPGYVGTIVFIASPNLPP